MMTRPCWSTQRKWKPNCPITVKSPVKICDHLQRNQQNGGVEMTGMFMREKKPQCQWTSEGKKAPKQGIGISVLTWEGKDSTWARNCPCNCFLATLSPGNAGQKGPLEVWIIEMLARRDLWRSSHTQSGTTGLTRSCQLCPAESWKLQRMAVSWNVFMHVIATDFNRNRKTLTKTCVWNTVRLNSSYTTGKKKKSLLFEPEIVKYMQSILQGNQHGSYRLAYSFFPAWATEPSAGAPVHLSHRW